MATCKQCREFEKCKDDAFINGAKFDPNESVEYCTGFEPITNSDRIRAMNDEELSEYIAGLIDDTNSGSVIYSNRTEEWLEWLKQPAE